MPKFAAFYNLNIVGYIQRSSVVRFVCSGVLATAIQYFVYYILKGTMPLAAAWTVGYLISFLANYFLTTLFTFHVRPTRSRALLFALCHVVNWGLQTLSLEAFVYCGLSEELAPLAVYAVCVPVNFLMLRRAMRRRH